MKSIDHRSRWKDGREALTILASPQYTSQREIPGLATGISNALRSFIKHGFATKLRWMTGTYNRVYICLKRAAVGSKRSVYVAGDMLIGDDLSEEIIEGIGFTDDDTSDEPTGSDLRLLNYYSDNADKVFELAGIRTARSGRYLTFTLEPIAESTQEITLASKTQDDSFNSKLLDIFRAPVTKASAQVEAIKSAADSWQSTVEGLVMARAARLMGTSLPGDAEEKSRNALSDLLAAVEAVDGMPELMREMLGSQAATPAPVRAMPAPSPSTSSPSSPLSGDSAAMEPDPVVPQPPRPLALATSIHDRAMIDLKPRRWPKTTKASETKPVLVVSVEKAAQATEMVMRSEAVQWTWDLISVVRDAEVIAARIKSGKYSGVVVFIHSINLQSGAISIIRSACESSRTPFASAPKQGTGSTANALETIESELKKAST